MDNISILVSARIPVPVEKVYKAWSDEKLIIKWFSEEGEMRPGSVEMDRRVGGKYRATMNILNEAFTVSGEYKEIVPNEKIVYTQGWEDPLRLSTLVTVEFRKKDFGTEIILTQDHLANEDEAEGHKSGWERAFARLSRKFAEGAL